MKTKRLNLVLVHLWEPILLWLVGLVVASGLLFFKLGNLVPHFSSPEVKSHAASHTLKAIVNVPFNAPYKLMVYGLNGLGHNGAFALRSVSVLVALGTLMLFYYVLSNWQSRTTAIIGSILFASSAWFLHYARFATPDIASTLLLASLAYGIWLRKTKHSAFVAIVGIVIAVWLLYIPGLIWFVVIGGIWQSRRIGEHLKSTKLSIPVIILIGTILLVPLVSALARQPALIKQLVGLPATNLPNAYILVRQILSVPMQIFFRGQYNPVVWLGRLPMLDIFTATMCLLGIYAYWQKRQLDRTKLLAATIIIASILVGLRGSVSIIILAPYIYILSATGVVFLLRQWLSVFPRNPLAKTVGVTLIVVAVALSCFYNLRQYFVAWSQSPATKRAYQRRI